MLNAYEQEQIRLISGWKAESPMLIVEMMEIATHPIVALVKHLLPKKAVAAAVDVAYKASEVFAHQPAIAEKAGVTDIRELKNRSLEECDRLADEFARKAGEGALVRGAVISSAGGLGAVMGLEVMVTFALKCVHTVGFCYGFSAEEPHEKEFALCILMAAAAGSLQDKQRAIHELHTLDAAKIEQDAVDEALDETAEAITEEVTENLAEEGIEQVSQTMAEDLLTERVLESTALSAVPLLGILVGAIADAATAEYIGRTAKHVFQERWLRANAKVTTIAPDPSQIRSRFSRAEGALSAGVYWMGFATSFVVSWPLLLLTSFVPPNSPVARGCADGSQAAVRDYRKLVSQKRVANPTAAERSAAVVTVPG